jgi:hypothetical protein
MSESLYSLSKEINYPELYEKYVKKPAPKDVKYTICVIISEEYISVYGDKLNHLNIALGELFIVVCHDYKSFREDERNIYKYNLDDCDFYLINKAISNQTYLGNNQIKIKIDDLKKFKLLQNDKVPKAATAIDWDNLESDYNKFSKRDMACIMLGVPYTTNNALNELIKMSKVNKKADE